MLWFLQNYTLEPDEGQDSETKVPSPSKEIFIALRREGKDNCTVSAMQNVDRLSAAGWMIRVSKHIKLSILGVTIWSEGFQEEENKQ